MKQFTLPTLLCVLTLSFFSCSTDNNDTTTETTANTSNFQLKKSNKIDLATAKQFYVDMMATQEYTDYKSALATFTGKLLLNEVRATNKAEWMSWINNNLNKTGFSSIAEFETIYDDTTNKLSKMISANIDLYDFIGNADLIQVGEVLEPEFANHTVDYPSNTDTCLDNCIDTTDAQLDELETQYTQNLQLAALSGDFGYTVAVEANYENAYIEIALDFNACAGAC
ncbi:hypothetical protein [Flavobacterium litorale]|uniref:Lipoprotein n=1 Tax=Flavobacterium litorale TaxID=2856519 RepID=A0ABX8V7R2_9FLAO|nr:hypothetical protein [Flavobacterium litorale]QYJ68872.1 hypothetical protein K1I41_03030 [Flavobacterium litorale]